MTGVVYGLMDPRKPGIRYVGMTVQPMSERLAQHCSEARNPARRSTRRLRWVGRLMDAGVRPTAVKLEWAPSPTDLEAAEIFWIHRCRAMGFDLVNTAPGGEGRRGPMSVESKAKMSAAGKGRPKSVEHRAAISAALRGKPKPPRTDEWRAAHSAKMTGREHSADTRAKQAAAATGRRRPWAARERPRDSQGRYL